jgi:hypothetical protein
LNPSIRRNILPVIIIRQVIAGDENTEINLKKARLPRPEHHAVQGFGLAMTTSYVSGVTDPYSPQ